MASRILPPMHGPQRKAQHSSGISGAGCQMLSKHLPQLSEQWQGQSQGFEARPRPEMDIPCRLMRWHSCIQSRSTPKRGSRTLSY
jgi:hypothetical protein